MSGCKTCLFCESGVCTLSKLPVKSYQPACVRYKDRAEAISESSIRGQKQLDRLLTLTFNTASAAQQFLQDFDDRVTYLNQEVKWRQEKKKAMNTILDCCKKIQTQYEQFILPDIIKATAGKDKTYEDYDNNQMDVNELCLLVMKYSDKCFQSPKNVNTLFGLLDIMEGENVFTESDYKRYQKMDE